MAHAPSRVSALADHLPIYYHFRRWRLSSRLRRAHDRLREEARGVEGRDRNPNAAVIDSQVVKTIRVGGPERGYDGALSVSLDRSVTYWWTRADWCWPL